MNSVNSHYDDPDTFVKVVLPGNKLEQPGATDVCMLCLLPVCKTPDNCEAAVARAEQLGLAPDEITVRRFTKDEQLQFSLYADDAEYRAGLFSDQLRGCGCLWTRWISYLFEDGSNDLIIRYA